MQLDDGGASRCRQEVLGWGYWHGQKQQQRSLRARCSPGVASNTKDDGNDDDDGDDDDDTYGGEC